MQVRPKLTKGQAKDLDLAPDILVVIVCSTDQPSGAGSLRCRLGKTKLIMSERMISYILKKAWYNSRQEVRETRWRLRQTQSHFPSWFVEKLVPGFQLFRRRKLLSTGEISIQRMTQLVYIYLLDSGWWLYPPFVGITKHSDAKLNQKRKPLYFKVLIDWATFLSHPCLDRPSWPIQLLRHENWSTPRCCHHQKVLFALFVYCF